MPTAPSLPCFTPAIFFSVAALFSALCHSLRANANAPIAQALTSLPQIIEFDQAQDEAPMEGADRSQAPDAADK
jgi:hypothetical protein